MSARRGFSLVEVLIAMAITALIMNTVSQALESTSKAVDAIHNLVESESTGPKVLELLREDLARLAVYDTKDYKLLKGDNEMIFGADADRLDLVVYSQSKVPFEVPGMRVPTRAAVNEIGYRVRESPLRKDFLELYRREDPMLDDRPLKGGSFTLMYDRVVSFDLGYAANPENSPAWKDNWDSESEESLPFAIRVFLEMEVQPRKSYESIGIMGANLSRLDFEDFMVIPEETRWRFRHRIHPTRVEEDDSSSEPTVPGSGEGEEAGTPSSVPSELEQGSGGGEAPAPTRGG